MITIRRARERGRTKLDWLDSRHTFSFGDYHDPHHQGYRTLRVINDDRVAPGGGFGRHPHRDMEIISYVLEGALEHEDSTGQKRVLRAGEVQVMSAGRGISHSEFNHSKTEPVHFLQIWIFPRAQGLPPRYDQRPISPDSARGKLRLVAAPEGAAPEGAAPEGGGGALTIQQDARVHLTVLEAGDRAALDIDRGRGLWVHVARGRLRVNGEPVEEGDGAALTAERRLELEGGEGGGEALVFDLA